MANGETKMKKRIHVHVTPDQDKKLRELSDKTGAPVAWLIRQAIDKYLETE